MQRLGFLLLLFLMALPGRGFAQAPVYRSITLQSDELPITLNGYWRYHPGDDSSWAEPGFDDSRWTFRHSFFPDLKDTSSGKSAGWFRLKIVVDSQLAGKQLAITLLRGLGSKVYLDGRLLTASVPRAVSSPALDSVVPLDPPLLFNLDRPGEHLLAVRMGNPGLEGTAQRGKLGFAAIVNHGPDAVREYNLRSTTIASVFVLFCTFFASIGLLHFILFLYYRARRNNLYFALFCLSVAALFGGAYSYISLSLRMDEIWADIFSTVLISTAAASLSGFLNELFGSGRLRFRLMQAMIIVGIAAPFVEIVADYAFPLLMAAIVIEAMVLILRAIIRRAPGARIIGVGILFFALTVILICVLSAAGPQYAMTLQGAIGTMIGVSVILATICIPLSMSAYLAWSFADVNRRLGRQLSEVERLSAAALQHEAEKQRLLEGRAEELEAQVMLRTEELRGQKEKSEELLRNILPAEVAEELKEKGSAAARHYDNVSVLFTDFADFTQMSEKMTPEELVSELNQCFSAFDAIITRHGLEKIKTVGDAYIAVAGLPVANERHAKDVIAAALEIRDFMAARREGRTACFSIRLGVHSGAVVAGIVGLKKFAYDIWGDTVNTAARMEQHSEPGQINISSTTEKLVQDEFRCKYRGELEAKHKGRMGMYFVDGWIESPVTIVGQDEAGTIFA